MPDGSTPDGADGQADGDGTDDTADGSVDKPGPAEDADGPDDATKEDGAADPDSGPGPRNKVARVVDEYGLEAAPAELEAAWTRTTDRKSLRELADDLNRRLLRSAMREAGLDPIDADVGSAYRALTDDSDGASRVQKARELERQGVDVDSLQDDFVSHQAIHTYLRRYRNVEPPESDDEDRLDAERDRVERLQGRMRAVAEDAVGRLRDADEIALDGFDVVASIDVHCEECGRSYRVGELLRRGGCACQQPE